MECNSVRLIMFFSVSEFASFGDVSFVKHHLYYAIELCHMHDVAPSQVYALLDSVV